MRQLKVFFIVSVGVILATILATIVLACTAAPPDFTNPEMWNMDFKKSWESLDKNLKLAGFKMTDHGQMDKFTYGTEYYYRYQKGDVKVSATMVEHPGMGERLCAVAVEGKLGADLKKAFLIGYIANTISMGGLEGDWFKNQMPKDIAEFWDRQRKSDRHIWKKGSYNAVILRSAVSNHVAFEVFHTGAWAPLIDSPPVKQPNFFSHDLWTGKPAVCFHLNIRQAGFKMYRRTVMYHNNAVCDVCFYRKGDVAVGVFMSDGYVRSLKITGMPLENFQHALLAGYIAMNLGLPQFNDSDRRQQWFDFGLSQQFGNIWAQCQRGCDLWGEPISMLIRTEGNGRIYALLDSPGWINQALQLRVP